MKFSTLTGLLASGFFTVSTQATLYDQGNGLIYDDVMDRVWLEDTNQTYTTGHAVKKVIATRETSRSNEYATNGNRSGRGATWAAHLAYSADKDRRPSADPLHLMHYNGLSRIASSPLTSPVSFNDPIPGGETVRPIKMQSYQRFYSVEIPLDTTTIASFATTDGTQNSDSTFNNNYGWKTGGGKAEARDIPAAAWLFYSALMGIAGLKPKNHNTKDFRFYQYHSTREL